MILTKAEEYKLLHLLLDMGEMMFCSGGEVRRVENTISLMGKAYGAVETNVMVITASIIVTMKFADGNLITESRRVESPASIVRAMQAKQRRSFSKDYTLCF